MQSERACFEGINRCSVKIKMKVVLGAVYFTVRPRILESQEVKLSLFFSLHFIALDATKVNFCQVSLFSSFM